MFSLQELKVRERTSVYSGQPLSERIPDDIMLGVANRKKTSRFISNGQSVIGKVFSSAGTLNSNP